MRQVHGSGGVNHRAVTPFLMSSSHSQTPLSATLMPMVTDQQQQQQQQQQQAWQPQQQWQGIQPPQQLLEQQQSRAPWQGGAMAGQEQGQQQWSPWPTYQQQRHEK